MSRSFTAYDVQKIRLDKLMSNIDKPIEIPLRKEEKKFAEPPDFVRNIMGSSAGAGSGEFHVYRHLRRKEYARLRHIETQAKQEELETQYQRRIAENKRIADEKTAKKRAKRLKKKQKLKARKLSSVDTKEKTAKESDETDDSDDQPIDNS